MQPITAEQQQQADETFIKTAFSGNELHVQASLYALEQVSAPHVRALAEQLVRDHEQAGGRTAEVAEQTGIGVSRELLSGRPKLLPPHHAMLDEARKTKGEAFASVYLFNMTSLHVHDVLDFAHAATHSPTAAIREFAAQTLPTLQQHLAMVRPMAEREAGLTGGLEGTAGAGRP